MPVLPEHRKRPVVHSRAEISVPLPVSVLCNPKNTAGLPRCIHKIIVYSRAVCFTRFSPFATAGIEITMIVITASTSR